jgi:pimeloyl-ACP methyl ester carboxylesterase
MTEPRTAPTASAPMAPYHPRRAARGHWIDARGLRMHLHVWGDPAAVTDDAPLRVMVHGWMDMGASFQFVVDALDDDRPVVAPDWRGFGLTERRAPTPTGFPTTWATWTPCSTRCRPVARWT